MIITQEVERKKAEVRTSIAKVMEVRQNNCYELQTEAGHKFIARDEKNTKPNVGDKVFYDQNRLIILELAPNTEFDDIPV